MNRQLLIAGTALLALAAAAAAQDTWPIDGWSPGLGSGMGLGRVEGPVTADVWQIDGGSGVAITVSGCGGVRDYRSFGTEIVGGEGESRAAAAALTRLLAEARRACGFEERLATRLEQGFGPAFAAWERELAQVAAEMNAMNMTDMNAAIDCSDGSCNGL
jgi:hypothetical protein